MRTVHAIARPDPDQPGSYRGTCKTRPSYRSRGGDPDAERRARAACRRPHEELERATRSSRRSPIRSRTICARRCGRWMGSAESCRPSTPRHWTNAVSTISPRVRAGAQRMGTMIDELLQLSRIARRSCTASDRPERARTAKSRPSCGPRSPTGGSSSRSRMG